MLLLDCCLQTCMTHTIAECTVNKLLMMDRGTVRNMKSFMTKLKFAKLVHLVGLIIKKQYAVTAQCTKEIHCPKNKLL